MRPATPELIAARSHYIQRWQGHFDAYFGHVDVADKRVVVLGGGSGCEALWALKRGARAVVSVDPVGDDRRPFDMALDALGLTHLAAAHTLHAGTTLTLPAHAGVFDLALTNNVLEHVFGLGANLAALASLLPHKGSRVHVFTDPLFFSSLGHHLPIGPWEHLSLGQEDVRRKVGPFQWREYREGLNGMTVTDFLGAVREAGLIVLDMNVRADPNLAALPAALASLPPGLKPMDLALAGIGCTLAFPHNL